MAQVHAGEYPDWKVDKAHPGYLIRFEPPALVRVPYHVLPTFPTGDALRVMWELSRSIRSSDTSIICLSGSNVLKRLFEVVGDVDFLEYLDVSDGYSFDGIVRNLDGGEKLICLRLALGERRWTYPWKADKPTPQFFKKTVNSDSDLYSSMKFDYVGEVQSIGIAEVTNLVIAIDKQGKSASMSKTFAAQEAPLVPIESLPNQMGEPVEMGRYIHWLLQSIKDYRGKGNMRKCLKRCASLSRVLFAADITNRIADIAMRSTVLLDHKLNELASLKAKLSNVPDKKAVTLLGILDANMTRLKGELETLGGKPDADGLKTFNDSVAKVADDLLSLLGQS